MNLKSLLIGSAAAMFATGFEFDHRVVPSSARGWTKPKSRAASPEKKAARKRQKLARAKSRKSA